MSKSRTSQRPDNRWRLLVPGLLALSALLVLGFLTQRSPESVAASPVATATLTVSATPSSTPTPTATSTPPETSGAAIDKAIRITDTVRDFLKEGVTWVLALLVLAFVFRKPLSGVVAKIPDLVGSRGLTVDVGTFKVTLSERPVDTAPDVTTSFSRSPFELSKETLAPGWATLGDIAPQIRFQVSDYVGRYRKDHGFQEPAERMEKARTALDKACVERAGVRKALEDFASALEESRFLEADSLVDRISEEPLATQVKNIQDPTDFTANGKDFLILHCLGIAHAQRSKWKVALEFFDRVVKKTGSASYLPASDGWLSASYNYLIESTPHVDLPKFLADVQALLERSQQALDAIGTDQGAWRQKFPSTQASVDYYRRELSKSIGTIYSILADYSEKQREPFLERARVALAKCTEASVLDPPSPLDLNNLADLYRQWGNFPEAHRQMDEAIRNSPPDPTFHNTRAMIYRDQGEPLRGMLSLEEYGEKEARDADAHDLYQDVEQYVDNLILEAKLAAAIEGGRALAINVLERARKFLVGLPAKTLQSIATDRLRAEILELLGVAYLQTPGNENRAAETFLGLYALPSTDPEVALRRRLDLVNAFIQLAKSQRRTFSSQAAGHWKAANERAAGSAAAAKALDLGSGALTARTRHLRLCLDTLVTNHALAEEGFWEEMFKPAQSIVTDAVDDLLRSLRDALKDQDLRNALGSECGKIESQLDIQEAQRNFLWGRILIHSDPGFESPALLRDVETSFSAARNNDPELNCLIDLEFGETLLAMALAGKGDVESLYDRAVASLQIATTRNAPALRNETMKALREAYARRGEVMRKANASKSST